MDAKRQRHKYYLTYMAKKQGFCFEKQGKTRLMYVVVSNGAFAQAAENKYVRALVNEFQFGLQIKNPLMA